jgi:very-short-patch-repair endonuclease
LSGGVGGTKLLPNQQRGSLVLKDSLDRFGSLPHNPKLMERAKEMRGEMTEAEKKLWDEVLRSKKTGYKFNRQKVIGNYILDFFCSELLLVIEVDGEIHNQTEKKEYDKEREKYLSSIGIKFLRFTNEEVLQDVGGVRQKIEEYLQAQFPLTRGLGGKVDSENQGSDFSDKEGSGGKGHEGRQFIKELTDSAIIREIHVYGKAVSLGKTDSGKAQHVGLGKELIERATEIAKEAGYQKLAVISAIGTREYYRQRGFEDGHLYQFRNLH